MLVCCYHVCGLGLELRTQPLNLGRVQVAQAGAFRDSLNLKGLKAFRKDLSEKVNGEDNSVLDLLGTQLRSIRYVHAVHDVDVQLAYLM